MVRYGAYGDLLVALPLIEELKRRYDQVQLETGSRGKELLFNHTALNRISSFDPHSFGSDNEITTANIRVNGLIHGGNWDFAVNLWRTLEHECIAGKRFRLLEYFERSSRFLAIW